MACDMNWAPGPGREELTFHDGTHGPLQGRMTSWRCVYREGIARASQIAQVVAEGANAPKCVGPLDHRVQLRWERDRFAPISCFHELQPMPDPCHVTKQGCARDGLSLNCPPDNKLSCDFGQDPIMAAMVACWRHFALPSSSAGMVSLSNLMAALGGALPISRSVVGALTNSTVCAA